MAIDRMKKVTFLCPVATVQRLLKTLHALSVVELVDVFHRYEGANEKLERLSVTTDDYDVSLQKINLILNLIDIFAPEKKSFVQGLAPVPIVVDPQEMNRTVEQFPLDDQYAVADDLDSEYRKIERIIGEVEGKLKELRPFGGIPFPVDKMRKIKAFHVFFGVIPRQGFMRLGQDGSIPATSAWEEVTPVHSQPDIKAIKGGSKNAGDSVWLFGVCLPENEEVFRKALLANGFEDIILPQIEGTVAEQVKALEGDYAELQQRVRNIAAKVETLATHRHAFLILKAFWEDCRKLAASRTNCAQGKWVQVVTGYMREKDCDKLESAIKNDFTNVTLVFDEIGPDETPPVSLSLSKAVRPIQMLVNLFGLPAYNTFDPSPFIMPTFLLFFGICFSDVAYGVMLIALSLYIMRKTAQFEGIYNFARLLFYAGISTVIFGFLLGSWFGDLYMPKYLGEGNIMYKIMITTQVIDPLQKPIVVLMMALTIGMFNQFYGIALKMYSAILRGDKQEALFDGLLWLVILPGFVLMLAKMFVPVPSFLLVLGILLFTVGAIGLVLTQGRASQGWIARLMTGVISLYGIVGTYGITAFIGDTMSYCRLLALALTTGIVALSFNMMADLLRPIPYVGIFLFVFVLIIAHVFNFLISVLGAFVHSMRLIFVEFFGRFYVTGSKPFTPLGFDSKSAILRKQL